MPIPRRLVELNVPPIEHRVDERWTMAYAASLDDHLRDYFDTSRPGGIVAHPLFSVCPEWPVIVSSREASKTLGITEAEVLTSVHATHDTTIQRLIRPGDELTTSLEIVGLTAKKPGTMSTSRLRTVDRSGEIVSTTTQHGIYLGVEMEDDAGEVVDPSPPPPLPDLDRSDNPTEYRVPLAAGDAHIYTECARIWNPIHTDPVVARDSGLPDIILHGTANLAHAVSMVVRTVGDGRPELVRRIVGRFSAMVELPSTLTVRVWEPVAQGDGASIVAFDVLNAHGAPAVSHGAIVLGER